LLTRVGIDYYPLHPKYRPFLLSEWISAALSLKKRHRAGVETETTMSAGEGPSSGRPRALGIEENRNTKRCRNWIRARTGEMAAKRETTMSIGERRSGGGVNPMPETRVLDWILSDSNEGPSNGKEERANEGAAKWARGMPHICEHKCVATTKMCRGSGEEGVEDLISDAGNDYDDGEASLSESHCLSTGSIDGA
jgi:hypothetical protein